MEPDLGVSGGGDIGVPVADPCHDAGKLDDHLVPGQSRELAVEHGERAIELVAAHGVEQILVPARQLARQVGEVFPPLANGGGVGRTVGGGLGNGARARKR
jgi:hypothetical protein